MDGHNFSIRYTCMHDGEMHDIDVHEGVSREDFFAVLDKAITFGFDINAYTYGGGKSIQLSVCVN